MTDGMLTFTHAMDLEDTDHNDGDGSYEVTIHVTDGADQDTADLVATPYRW